jgi:hypothetical protein
LRAAKAFGSLSSGGKLHLFAHPGKEKHQSGELL